MAKIVAGVGTPMSPIVSINPREWAEYTAGDLKRNIGLADGRNVTYEQLKAENGDKYAAATTPARAAKDAAAINTLLDRAAGDIVKATPDIVIVIADDNKELFNKSNVPAIAIYHGEEISNTGGAARTASYISPNDTKPDAGPLWRQEMFAAQSVDPSRHYPGAPAFADELVAALALREFDVAVATAPEEGAKGGICYGVGFAINRLLGGKIIPVVPVLLNPNQAPNIPTMARCYKLGQAIRAVLEENGDDQRVAIIGTGGICHIGPNEKLDRTLMEAIRTRDLITLTGIPYATIKHSGAGQMLSWMVMLGATEKLQNRWTEYLQVTRTPVGTGIGLGFAGWN